MILAFSFSCLSMDNKSLPKSSFYTIHRQDFIPSVYVPIPAAVGQ